MSVLLYSINGKKYMSSVNTLISGGSRIAPDTQGFIINVVDPNFVTDTTETQTYNCSIIGLIRGVAQVLYELYLPLDLHTDIESVLSTMESKQTHVVPQLFNLEDGKRIVRQYNETYNKSTSYINTLPEDYEDQLFVQLDSVAQPPPLSETARDKGLSERDLARLTSKALPAVEPNPPPFDDPTSIRADSQSAPNPKPRDAKPSVRKYPRIGGTRKNKRR
jgi:hypothetical protein